jgi:hypothetical protein
MRSTAPLALAPLVSLLLGISGCQRLDADRTVKLEPSQVHAILFDAPRSDQKVSVTMSSPGAPVEVYLLLEKDREAAVQSLEQGKRPAKEQILASKDKAEEATLEATVPAKSGYAVLLNSKAGKTAEVKVKVAGR